MAITTYSELKSTVADWLNRSDLTATVPTFIQLAESAFNRRLRVRQMVKRANATVDTQFFAFPSDFLEVKSFQLNTVPLTRLTFVTEDQANALRANTYLTSGKPVHFSVIGTQMEVVPTPDTSYTGELTYFAKIPALSDSNTSNWLLEYAPDLYLYGTLMQSAPYLRDDERTALWAGLHRSIMDDIVAADERASTATTPIVRARTLG